MQSVPLVVEYQLFPGPASLPLPTHALMDPFSLSKIKMSTWELVSGGGSLHSRQSASFHHISSIFEKTHFFVIDPK